MSKLPFESELIRLLTLIINHGLRTRPSTSTVSISMASITDTAFTSLTTNDYLKYNGTNWVNTTIAASDLPTAIDAINIADGSVSNTEFQYLDGVTSAIQTQMDTKITISSTDTLTNKTINTASNTITIVEADISDLGAYITISSTDTLTNKTLNLTSNTLVGSTAQFNTALSDGSFTTLAGSETLTNKTINSASNTITITESVISDLGSYITASSTDTLTNKTFDANGTGNSLSNVDVADLANGTDGELITWDSSAAPTTVAAGTATQVLTSNGAGAAPTFQAAGGGGFTAATQAEQETGTSTTVGVTPGRQQYHQSAAKAWAHCTGTGTVSVDASYNITSITDNGTGDYTITLDTDMSSVEYAVLATAETDTVRHVDDVTTRTVTAVRLRCVQTDGSLADATTLDVTFYGDQ